MTSFKSRLANSVNRAGRVTYRSADLEWLHKKAATLAKAETYIANHPAPRCRFF